MNTYNDGTLNKKFPPGEPSDYVFLPVAYTLDLSSKLPSVDVHFYLANYCSRAILLKSVRLKLNLYGAPPIEDIPLRNEHVRIEARSAPLVVFRRNLSDLEFRAINVRAGRDAASYELTAVAHDGDRSLNYGPVSSMAIDGWVHVQSTPD